jgi:hypothetical protein
MKEFPQTILTVFIGVNLYTMATSYYETSKSAQKIENIEKMIHLKQWMDNQKSVKETEQYIKQVTDSINNN